MWLISNPLFEIGAGLVLIAATVWMLLNATAPRPRAAAPAAVPPTPPPVLVPSESVPSLGPLSVRGAKGMFFADETEPAEPPLRLAAEPREAGPPITARRPPIEMRLPDFEPEPAPEPAAPVEAPILAIPPSPHLPEPPTPVLVSETVAEPQEPAPAENPAAEPDPQPPAAVEAAPEPVPEIGEAPAVEPAFDEESAAPLAPPEEASDLETVEAVADTAPGPQTAVAAEGPEPVSEALAEPGTLPEPLHETAPEPVETPPPFEAQFPAWLAGLLAAVPTAPPPATVVAAAARVKRAVDPAWPEPARDLRAAIETLGKLAPAAFAQPGAREATAAVAAAVGTPFALIWPQAGDAFDPARHEARLGEGGAVAALVRPGVAWGEDVLPALVSRGPA